MTEKQTEEITLTLDGKESERRKKKERSKKKKS